MFTSSPSFAVGYLGFAWTAYSSYTDLDGVWVRTDVFGNEGPQLDSDVYNENKTLIHEVGHFVRLASCVQDVEYCGEDLGDLPGEQEITCATPRRLNSTGAVKTLLCPPGAYGYTLTTTWITTWIHAELILPLVK